MREELKRLGGGIRHTFTAKISKFSFKSGFRNRLPLKTMLLTKITCEGKVVANHIWMTCGRRVYSILPQVNQWIQFDARVTKYFKGYKKNIYGGEEDYRLSYPTKVVLIKKRIPTRR